MKKTYKVELLGNEYNLLSDASEEEVLEVISYLKKKTEEVYSKVHNLPQTNILFLAALNIASDFIQENKTNKKLKKEIFSKAENIINIIDTNIEQQNNTKNEKKNAEDDKILNLF
ncbi:MAG: cell division protein ZapA [Pseudomonadota bacterium]